MLTEINNTSLISFLLCIGEVELLKDSGDISVSRICWGLGSEGEEFKVKGTDIITIREGRIERCYTFLDK
jgi:hypothetical protein